LRQPLGNRPNHRRALIASSLLTLRRPRSCYLPLLARRSGRRPQRAPPEPTPRRPAHRSLCRNRPHDNANATTGDRPSQPGPGLLIATAAALVRPCAVGPTTIGRLRAVRPPRSKEAPEARPVGSRGAGRHLELRPVGGSCSAMRTGTGLSRPRSGGCRTRTSARLPAARRMQHAAGVRGSARAGACSAIAQC